MSVENLISIEIPSEKIAKAQDAIKTLENLLREYLISLTAEDRKETPKLGDKNLPFVNKTLDYSVTNPEFVPPYMSVPELRKDIDAVIQLNQLYRPLLQLADQLSDTIMLAGSEAYGATLAYYNSVKQAAKMNVPGAKLIYEELSKRFAIKPKKAE
jgi:hypothetical protein